MNLWAERILRNMGYSGVISHGLTSHKIGVVQSIIVRGIVAVGSVVEKSISIGIGSWFSLRSCISITPLAANKIGMSYVSIIVRRVVAVGSVVKKSISIGGSISIAPLAAPVATIVTIVVGIITTIMT